MAIDIRDFGGIEGDSSIGAAETNVQAIHDASLDADDNTVYLPEGDWYVGHSDRASFIWPGIDVFDAGVAGLGFTGDGPEKSFLTVSPEAAVSGGMDIRYAEDTHHANTTWDNITLDGNQHNLTFSGLERQRGINIRGGGDFTFENVRFRNIHANGVHGSSGGGYSFDFNRCSFYHVGIGQHNDHDGDSVGHAIVIGIDPDQHCSITNCKFELVAGTCFDISQGTEATVTNRNVWAAGVGDAYCKINDADVIEMSNLYFEGETDELHQALSTDAPSESTHNGRSLFYRLQGTEGAVPTVILNNVETHNLPMQIAEAYRGYDLAVEGGYDGPIAAFDTATIDSRDAAWWEGGYDTSAFHFDIGEMSVHRTDGYVFGAAASDGSVDTLHRDQNRGLGDIGSISIANDVAGGQPFSPNVPSKSDVGINSSGDTDDGDGDEDGPELVSYTWVITHPDGTSETLSGETASFDPHTNGDHEVELTVENDLGLADRASDILDY